MAATLAAAQPQIVVETAGDAPHRVGLVGLDVRTRALMPDDDAQRRALAVYAGAIGPDTPQMAGTYEATADALHFRPLFRFSPGVPYTVRVRIGSLAMERSFQVDAAAHEPPRVAAVRPSGDTLPENALRLYVHFSRSMAMRDAARHVRLLDAEGQEVALAFVEVEGGLWDPGRTRLTLLFHPGRVKRGVAPGERMGPPLRAGREYRLVVDAAMADASGVPLGTAFEHRFRTVEADREPPREEGVRVEPPASRLTPVSVQLPEPLDQALLARWVWVEDARGARVEGRVDAQETRWALTPERPWAPGSYVVRIERALEDRAGNRFDRAFDREPGAPAPEAGPPLRFPFAVR